MRLATFTSLVALALLGAVAPASAQTFVFGAQGEPVQFDPAVITDGISSRITRQVFDGLVKYKGATTEVEPALAEKWEVSPDGRVWTFRLRPNVKFHDGTPLDAAAVVWNFERWWKASHPQHDNQVKAGQTFEYWEAQFGGFDDKSIVSAVEAVGPHTVRITLKEPQAPFLANRPAAPTTSRPPSSRPWASRSSGRVGRTRRRAHPHPGGRRSPGSFAGWRRRSCA